jgi:hypothetical protein
MFTKLDASSVSSPRVAVRSDVGVRIVGHEFAPSRSAFAVQERSRRAERCAERVRRLEQHDESAVDARR